MTLPILNRKLVLETPTRQSDGAGGYASGWAPVGTLWAHVRPRSGRETGGLASPVSQNGFRITLRGAPVGSDRRPTPDQRLRDGGRLFHILAVTEADPEGRYLVCEAREEVST